MAIAPPLLSPGLATESVKKMPFLQFVVTTSVVSEQS